MPKKGYVRTPEHQAKLTAAMTGKKRSLESIERYKISNKGRNLGRVHTDETRRKISESELGAKNHNWQGGKTKKHLKERNSLDYRLWRNTIFNRDGYICSLCSTIDGIFQVDHIRPFATHPELRLDLSNGRVLCVDCHRQITNYHPFSKRKVLV